MSKLDISLYIHWPYCVKKCPYCAFNSVPLSFRRKYQGDAEWKSAFLANLQSYRSILQTRNLRTIFVGGGTPSLMNPSILAEIFETLDISSDVEITLEVNPIGANMGDFLGLSKDVLKAFKDIGVNRLSLGIQSFDDKVLKFLERDHTAYESKLVLDRAFALFDRLTFDLIYAHPLHESVGAWEQELLQALEYGRQAGHMSLYQLTIEESTPFYLRHQRGEWKMPAEDLAVDLYEATNSMMAKEGFLNYEISSYARPYQESRHNMVYWQGGDYLPLGPGAHGRITMDGRRYSLRHHRGIAAWLLRSKRYGSAEVERFMLSPQDYFREMLLAGLRLKSGVNLSHVERLTSLNREEGLDLRKVQDFYEFIRYEGHHLEVTPKGSLILNSLLKEIVR